MGVRFRVQGSGFRVQGSECRPKALTDEGASVVQGARFRVKGAWGRE